LELLSGSLPDTLPFKINRLFNIAAVAWNKVTATVGGMLMTDDDANPEDPFQEHLSEAEFKQIEHEFLEQLVEQVKHHQLVPGARLKRQDFFYGMLYNEQCVGHDVVGEDYVRGWIMPASHLVARVMQSTLDDTGLLQYAPIVVMDTPIGVYIIYSADQIDTCIDDITALCISHGISVQDAKEPPPPIEVVPPIQSSTPSIKKLD
jgi:hypothetical protein